MPRKRFKNPSTGTVLVAAAVLAAGAGGAWYYVKTQDEKKRKEKEKAKKKKADAPAPELPRPTEDEKDVPTEPSEDFGIIFNDDCTDFTYIEPPSEKEGLQLPQMQAFMDTMKAAIDAAKNEGAEYDPLEVAADALNAMSPDQCEFPPAVDGPDRLVQLYLYMSAIMGVAAISEGVEIEGVNELPDLDSELAKRFGDLGYPAFDPTVIPEILPDGPDTKLPGSDEPPALGEFVPSVSKLTPGFIMADNKVTKVYAEGKLNAETQIRLFDENSLEDIEELDVDYFGPGTLILNVKSMAPGNYRAFVRQDDNEDWKPTSESLEVRAFTYSLGVNEAPTYGIDEAD